MNDQQTTYCLCNPNIELRVLVTQKEGKNQGRWFFTCKKCHQFQWFDDWAKYGRKPLSPKQQTTPSPTPFTNISRDIDTRHHFQASETKMVSMTENEYKQLLTKIDDMNDKLSLLIKMVSTQHQPTPKKEFKAKIVIPHLDDSMLYQENDPNDEASQFVH